MQIEQNKDILLRRMLSRVNNDFDKSVGSFSYDLLSPVSFELVKLSQTLQNIDDKRSINNLKGEELDLFVEQYTPLKRRKATHSHGYVQVTGKPLTKYEIGMFVASVSSQYMFTEEGKLDEDGNATIKVESEETGVETNTDKNTVTSFPFTIQGLETVDNEEPITGGYNEESDESFRRRYFEFLSQPITSGNVYHYKAWAKSVVGVGEAKVIPLWNGNGTVKVVIVDDQRGEANKELIEDVYNYIESVRPIGATVTVESAKPKEIVIKSDVKLADRYEIKEVEKSFIKNLEDYRSDIAFTDSYISYAKIGKILLETDGVLDYENLTLNGEQNNIALASEETPIFTQVSLSVVI